MLFLSSRSMAVPSRYNVSDREGEYWRNNRLGLQDEESVHSTESILIQDSYQYFSDLLDSKKVVFESKLLIEIHKYFLGNLYTWAGKLRRVDVSKNGIMFASCRFLPQLLEEFDRQLKKYLPQSKDTKKEVARRLAFIHNELNAIHPFREGNGRALRLFLDLSARAKITCTLCLS